MHNVVIQKITYKRDFAARVYWSCIDRRFLAYMESCWYFKPSCDLYSQRKNLRTFTTLILIYIGIFLFKTVKPI